MGEGERLTTGPDHFDDGGLKFTDSVRYDCGDGVLVVEGRWGGDGDDCGLVVSDSQIRMNANFPTNSQWCEFQKFAVQIQILRCELEQKREELE